MWRNNQGWLENPLLAPVAVCLLVPPALCLVYRTASVPTALQWLRTDMREWVRPVAFFAFVALLVGVALGRTLVLPGVQIVQTPLQIAPDGTWWSDVPGRGLCQIRRSDEHGWQCLRPGGRWESMEDPPAFAVVMGELGGGGSGQAVPSAFLGISRGTAGVGESPPARAR